MVKRSISRNSTFRYSAIEKNSKFHFQFAFETTRNESMHIWSYAYAHCSCGVLNICSTKIVYFFSIFESDDDKSLRPTQNDRNVSSSCWSVCVCVLLSIECICRNLILLHTIFCAETEMALHNKRNNEKKKRFKNLWFCRCDLSAMDWPMLVQAATVTATLLETKQKCNGTFELGSSMQTHREWVRVQRVSSRKIQFSSGCTLFSLVTHSLSFHPMSLCAPSFVCS